MNVYRIEHTKSGCGPYHDRHYDNAYDLGRVLSDSHTGSSKHPTLNHDLGSAVWGSDTLCGCPTLAKLKAWFEGYGKALAAEGFVVRVFEPRQPRRGMSGRQVFFNGHKRAAVREFPITWE